MEDVEEFPPDPKPAKNGDDEKKIRPTVRSATDLQRLKVVKLMKNPNKQIIIPESPREKDYLQSVPSFVRNVMGSSAGAGSGEFHVYRHLRRKEYARQKFIQSKSLREQLDDEYRDKLERNKSIADSKTAKKRAKRQKRKQKQKEIGKKPKLPNQLEAGQDNYATSSDESVSADESDKNKMPLNNPDEEIKDCIQESNENTEEIKGNDNTEHSNSDIQIQTSAEDVRTTSELPEKEGANSESTNADC